MSLRNEQCFQELADGLKELAQGKPMVEILNSGNWGDALILAGQERFFADVGIEVERIRVQKLSKTKRSKELFRRYIKKRRAIFTGSGALRKHYKRPEQFQDAARQFEHVLVMPSSYEFAIDHDPKHMTFWRRDNLESVASMPDARFCHDLAFYLQPAAREVTQEFGFFFREDVERASFDVPEGNVDISAEQTHAFDIEPFFDRVGACKIVHTNRLHVGIAATLLGREVHLYPSVNTKLESIYQASMRPFFDNVVYHDAPSTELYALAQKMAEA
ncbi:polysaccharide pyruvyl transferase family protein [uncultured Tateyamaria sp.]|uniref:polysaccharide pyruvyl transferase family protein n=1 Tax=uncultured Tateyamaria sp. TaxID=455651 RepID=UPI0026118BBD|nr:polysaccharide pyruvyl transferase family protein [uncultured Tateyamaria sp.]